MEFSPQPQPQDRRTGLLIFGVLQIILGVISIAVVLVVLAGHELAARNGTPAPGAALASAVVVYGVAAAYFLLTGIGSIRGRRWARALSVVVSAIWMIGGVVTGLVVALVLPRMLRASPQADATMIGGCAALAILIAGIAVPLAIFLFYRREDVKHTCEMRDPKPRWTDRVPLPVLAVILVLAFASVALLANLANPILSVLGREISGAPAAVTMFAFAGLSAFLALQLYRLKESAWWTLVLLQVIGVVYAIVMFARTNPDLLAPVGTPPEIAGIYRDPLFISIFAATWIAYFAFLLYLRRFFAAPVEPRTRRGDHSTFSV